MKTALIWEDRLCRWRLLWGAVGSGLQCIPGAGSAQLLPSRAPLRMPDADLQADVDASPLYS